MNNWIILAILIATVIVATIIINHTVGRRRYWVWPIYVYGICGVMLFFTVLIAGAGGATGKSEVNSFIHQKEYIEMHVPSSEIEDAALTVKKVELNEWLYGAQYSKARFEGWSLYPDCVEDLQEIK